MNKSINKYFAEFLGAFTLSLVVAFSVANNFSIVTPVLAALVLGTFVYTIGAISGSHINPAVTIGLWSVNKIKSNEAIMYVLAQVLGGIIASVIVYNFYGVIPMNGVVFSLKALIAEICGAILFTFGIASIVFYDHNKDYSGIVVGTSLLLGITVASFMGSMGVLNPAVSVGLKVYSLSYLFGSIIGSLIGFNLYKFISNSN